MFPEHKDGSLWKLFCGGKFTKCVSKLKNLVESEEEEIPVHVDMGRQADIAICDYLLNLEEKADGDEESTSQILQDLLQKCKSSVPEHESLAIELSVTYNYLYVKFRSESSECITDSVWLNGIYEVGMESLVRVCQLFESDVRKTVEWNTQGVKQGFYTSLHRCLESPVFGLEELWVPLCFLCCLLLLVEILNGDIEDTDRCLQALKRKDKLVMSQCTSSCFLLPFSRLLYHEAPDNMSLPHTELLDFLLGVCAIKQENWSQCRDCMKEVCLLPPLTALITGFTFYKEGRYPEAVSELSGTLREYGGKIVPSLKASVLSLLGSCLDKLNKPQLCVQMYKEALAADFTALGSLYKISLQYRKLGLEDAELEVLNLLTKSLEPDVEQSHGSLVLMDAFNFELEKISTLEAHYCLASRCLQLKRYDIAVQKYSSLLVELTEKNFKAGDLHNSKLPPAVQIYHEAINSMLCARRYKQCVELCEKVLSCYTPKRTDGSGDGQNRTDSDDSEDVTSFTTKNSSNLVDSSFKVMSRKRQRSSSSEVVGSEVTAREVLTCGLEVDVVTLMYKADALVQLEDFPGAATCLQSAIESLQTEIRTGVIQKSSETNYPMTSPHPHQKRQRLSSDGQSGPGQNEVSRASTGADVALELGADLYFRLGSTLGKQKQFSAALHFYRLSCQLRPDHRGTLYNLSVILFAMDCPREAAVGWLKTRGITTQFDSFQLANHLKTKQTQLRSAGGSPDCDLHLMDSVGEEHLLHMDVVCLQQLLRLQQTHHTQHR